ncbi:MAG: ribbon-helix-helix protein, CopG family [Oceanipulchritudo sp.]
MKTLTIKVPEELAIRIEKRARRLGITKSALIRQSIEEEMRGKASVEEAPTAYDLMRRDLGCIESGTGDLSSNPDHLKGFGK